MTLSKMRSVAILALILAPTFTLAHSMEPGSRVEQALTPVHQKIYTLSNDFDIPAAFKIEVFNEDFTPADGWDVAKKKYKLLPKSQTNVAITFEAQTQRKVIVCSILSEIGKNYEKALTTTRVCSRLTINSFTQ